MPDSADTWPLPPFAQWAQHRDEFRQFIREARHRARHGEPPFDRGGPGPGRGFGPGTRGFPFGFGGPMFGGGRRAGRGDIRSAILALLAEQPMHGYQIIQELERRTEGAWRPSPGSVYPTLQQLEDEGLVKAVVQAGERRVFELTDAGREQARASVQAPPWEEVAQNVDVNFHSLKKLLGQVAAATWQVGQAGTSRQLAAAHDVLRDTRRHLYQLLAEEPSPES